MSLKKISTRPKQASDSLIMETTWHDILADDMPPVDTHSLQAGHDVLSIDVTVLLTRIDDDQLFTMVCTGYFNFNTRMWNWYPYPYDDVTNNWIPRYWHVLPPLPEIQSESAEITP